ncbi:hypothetical protein L195_g016364 [Trifolium pratense]|uniref:Uncharacterized protein n=1 Tax=Trifolium pratense TaxID=57577 RepID=A0A2K3MQX7_TRIPR|nr:hypothetical protein L195_g016364 [Trifolium pratense]
MGAIMVFVVFGLVMLKVLKVFVGIEIVVLGLKLCFNFSSSVNSFCCLMSGGDNSGWGRCCVVKNCWDNGGSGDRSGGCQFFELSQLIWLHQLLFDECWDIEKGRTSIQVMKASISVSDGIGGGGNFFGDGGGGECGDNCSGGRCSICNDCWDNGCSRGGCEVRGSEGCGSVEGGNCGAIVGWRCDVEGVDTGCWDWNKGVGIGIGNYCWNSGCSRGSNGVCQGTNSGSEGGGSESCGGGGGDCCWDDGGVEAGDSCGGGSCGIGNNCWDSGGRDRDGGGGKRDRAISMGRSTIIKIRWCGPLMGCRVICGGVGSGWGWRWRWIFRNGVMRSRGACFAATHNGK